MIPSEAVKTDHAVHVPFGLAVQLRPDEIGDLTDLLLEDECPRPEILIRKSGADGGKPVHGVLAVFRSEQGDQQSIIKCEFHSVVILHVNSPFFDCGVVYEVVYEPLNIFSDSGEPFFVRNTFLPLVDVFR